MELFWVFTTAVLLIMLLIVGVRQGRTSWAWNFLIICAILFAGLFKMTGTPRDVWLFATIENLHGDMEVVSQIVIPSRFILLLIRKTPGELPYYVRLPWSKSIQDQLESMAMKAKEQQTALLVDVDRLSSWSFNTTALAAKHDHGHAKPSDDQGKNDGKGQPQGGKEGGVWMFYPKPVQADPLKTPIHNEIEVH